MENHIIPITMTKKIWNLVRVYFLMARKGISSKRKLLLDLNLMLKKGKIAGKALVGSLIFHHHHHHHRHHQNPAPTRTLSPSASFSTKGEYEFNCDHTPAHHAMFNFFHHHFPALHANGNKHKKGNKATSGNNNKNSEIDMTATGMKCPELFFDEENYEAVSRVLETLALREGDQGKADLSSLSVSSSLNYSSPAAYSFPTVGFGRSPRVRQLRVTDSPFPLANNEDDHRVDEAAEDFINRFYSQLRQQRLTPGPHGA